MSVVDDDSEVQDFNFSLPGLSYFNDPGRRVTTRNMGRTCDNATMHVVTNSSARTILDENQSADVYQGDIPRLFILKHDDASQTVKYVDIETGSLVNKTKHSCFQRTILNGQPEWVVKDVCNTIFSILIADIKVGDKRIDVTYYPSIVFYEKIRNSFESNGVKLIMYNKNMSYTLELPYLKLKFTAQLDLNLQNGLHVNPKTRRVTNLDLDKVLSWRKCN